MPLDQTAMIAVGLPFLAALVAPWLFRWLGHRAGWVLALAAAGSFLLMLRHLPAVVHGDVILQSLPWVPSLGLDLSFRIDGLSTIFALLISGIGVLIVLYAGAYLEKDPGLGRFFSFLMMFMGSMMGLVLADHLLVLFLFWELTSITSFLLIGYHHKEEASRRAALQALVFTGGGGLVLLAGLALVIAISGQTSLTGLLNATGLDLGALEWPVIFIIIGAFAKSAQFPFNVWLPNAMQAPTPVSAYLHSATMVKAGVYLLMRLDPVFGDMDTWQWVLPVFGGITLLLGAVLAIAQTDLKQMLAQTTVASLGLMVLLIGFASEATTSAAVMYLIAHALFKGCLFMVAGVIDHGTGTRDIHHLSGLRRAMPWTFAAGLFGALSMAGLPFFYGFYAKEEIYAAFASTPAAADYALIAVIIGNALMLAIAFQVGVQPFVGALRETPKHPHDGPFFLMAGPLALALKGLTLGLIPYAGEILMANPMASAAAGVPLTIERQVLPHWGTPLILTLITIGLGLACWRYIRPLRASVNLARTSIGWGPDRGFDQIISGLVGFSARLTRILQPGRLEIYLTTTFIVIAAMLIMTPLLTDEWPVLPQVWPETGFAEWAFIAIAIIGLGAVLFARSRLVAIVSLGIQGFAVAVLYLLYGAPDLAFTQFMVETLSVVILALVMTRLKLDASDRRPLGARLGDGLLAVLAGGGFAALLLKVTEIPFDRTLTDFFSQQSKIVAHGANVVNVIIVDFRGTDTLGEIAVVAITGLAILALVRLRAAPRESKNHVLRKES